MYLRRFNFKCLKVVHGLRTIWWRWGHPILDSNVYLVCWGIIVFLWLGNVENWVHSLTASFCSLYGEIRLKVVLRHNILIGFILMYINWIFEETIPKEEWAELELFISVRFLVERIFWLPLLVKLNQIIFNVFNAFSTKKFVNEKEITESFSVEVKPRMLKGLPSRRSQVRVWVQNSW